MAKFSKILIAIFSALFISGGFSVSHFSNAQTEGTVYVCPNATSLDEVYYGCPEMIILKLGETINGMTLTITNYNGKEYYTILGFVNGGAGVLEQEARLETQIAITEMIYGGEDILQEVTKNVGDKKSPLLLSELKEATVDLEDYTLEGKINPGQKKKLRMKFKLLETAGNEYQGKSIKATFKFRALQEK